MALKEPDLTPCQKQARALNGSMKPLQMEGQLVAQPVGKAVQLAQK